MYQSSRVISIAKLDRCFCYVTAAMFVSLRKTQTWRPYTLLYKFGWHTSAKSARMKNSRDLILGHSRPQSNDPSDLRQRSRTLAGPDFLSICRVFVSYSQPIRFARFDGNPWIADFRCWTKPELWIPAAGQNDRGSGDENDSWRSCLYCNHLSYHRFVNFF